jgi:hypothetical protein
MSTLLYRCLFLFLPTATPLLVATLFHFFLSFNTILVYTVVYPNLDTRWRSVFSFTSQPPYSRKRTPVLIAQEARWDPQPVYTDFEKTESFALPGFETRTAKPVVGRHPITQSRLLTETLTQKKWIFYLRIEEFWKLLCSHSGEKQNNKNEQRLPWGNVKRALFLHAWHLSVTEYRPMQYVVHPADKTYMRGGRILHSALSGTLGT